MNGEGVGVVCGGWVDVEGVEVKLRVEYGVDVEVRGSKGGGGVVKVSGLFDNM